MKEKSVSLLKDLIKIESYSGHEENIARFIKEKYEDLGVEVVRVEGNVVVFIPGKNHEKAFIFNSHMDTVTADPGWKYGPLNPTTEEDGKLIGLGASDMKSGLAASMLLGEYFTKAKPDGDMYFTYVVNEEVDGSGSKQVIEWMEKNEILSKYKEVGAIFTEPTDLNSVEHGHMGNVFLKLKLSGESSHGSRPIEDINHVVYRMVDFNNKLEVEYGKWRESYLGGELFPPSIAKLVSIWANVRTEGSEIVPNSPNKYPGVCYASIDLRTVPGFHEEIVELVSTFGESFGVEVECVADPAPSGLTESSDKLVKIASEEINSDTLVVSKGSADLGFFTQKGVKAIIVGPGVKLQCHRKDEYCYPEQVFEAIGVYEKIVARWFACEN